jgi:hypothetical protein
VDWEYDSRTPGDFRAFLEEHTRPEALSCLPWDGTLEPDSARALIDAFFAEQPRSLARRADSARSWIKWRRQLLGLPLLGLGLKWIQPLLQPHGSRRFRSALRPLKLIMRLAQLKMLHSCVVAKDFTEQAELATRPISTV